MRRSKPRSISTPSAKAPRSRKPDGLEQLRRVQVQFGSAVMRPLNKQWETQRTWTDGRDMETVAAEFVKPNDRLTSLERLELYNKQYWFRLIDCLYEDYPGLCAILGDRQFTKLAEAYIAKYPSRSSLLRNLGSNIERFITEEPKWAEPHVEAAKQMAGFEWAQVVAFDEIAKKPLTPDDLLGKDPTEIGVHLQPYITLLELDYALDEFLVAVKKQSLRGEASNATTGFSHGTRRKRQPKAGKTFIAVHRLNNTVYLKRLESDGYAILTALREGESVADAVANAIEASTREDVDWAKRAKEWFQQWMELGWFCRR